MSILDIIRLILVRLSDPGPCQWDDKDKREVINQTETQTWQTTAMGKKTRN